MQRVVRVWSRLFPNPGYYGWVIVGVGFLCSALSSPGQSFAVSLYLEPVMADLGLSRVQFSSLYAAGTLAAAACLPVLGSWADRMPSGAYLAGVLGALSLALFGFASVSGPVTLALAFFSVRLLGPGAVGLGTLTTTVQWFRRYRGRALAVVSLGYALGQMVFPGVVYGLLERAGWRGSLVIFGVLYLALFAPLVGWLARDRPSEDEGLDGDEPQPPDSGRSRPPARESEISYPLREVLRMRNFWAILLCLSVLPLLTTAVIFHQVALFGSLGWAASLVPTAFMAFAIGGVVMTYLAGLLFERVPSRLGITLSLGLSASAFVSMLVPLPPLGGALVYGTLLGLASGANAITNSIIWPAYFGTAAVGAVKGVVNAVRNAASAAGPPVAALLAVTTGSFATALILFAAVAVVAAASALLLRSPSSTAPPAADESPKPPGRAAETGRAPSRRTRAAA